MSAFVTGACLLATFNAKQLYMAWPFWSCIVIKRHALISSVYSQFEDTLHAVQKIVCALYLCTTVNVCCDVHWTLCVFGSLLMRGHMFSTVFCEQKWLVSIFCSIVSIWSTMCFYSLLLDLGQRTSTVLSQACGTLGSLAAAPASLFSRSLHSYRP